MKKQILIQAQTGMKSALIRRRRQPINQRRQHVFGYVPLKLFHGPEVLLACRTAGLNDFVLWAHERIQIVAQYFFSERAQKFRLFHDFTVARSLHS
jgi:hypothetical protein